MIFRLLLLLACLLPVRSYSNEVIVKPELVILYECDLAIDADLVRSDDVHFWVRVKTVLRDTCYGIKRGDHIRVDLPSSADSFFPWRPADGDRWRLYLRKEEGRGHWAVMYHEASYLIRLQGERTWINMPALLELPIQELDRCLIEFQTCYALSDTADVFRAITADARIDSLAAHNVLIAQLEKQGRSVSERVLIPPEVQVVDVPAAPQLECAWLDQPPRAIDSTIREPLVPAPLLDPTPNAPGSNTVLVRARIGLDGIVQDATVLHGSTPARNTAALRALAQMPVFRPGRMNGVATNCYFTIPVRFDLNGE